MKKNILILILILETIGANNLQAMQSQKTYGSLAYDLFNFSIKMAVSYCAKHSYNSFKNSLFKKKFDLENAMDNFSYWKTNSKLCKKTAETTKKNLESLNVHQLYDLSEVIRMQTESEEFQKEENKKLSGWTKTKDLGVKVFCIATKRIISKKVKGLTKFTLDSEQRENNLIPVTFASKFIYEAISDPITHKIKQYRPQEILIKESQIQMLQMESKIISLLEEKRKEVEI